MSIFCIVWKLTKIDLRFIYEPSRLIEPSFEASKGMYQLRLPLDRTVTSCWVGSLPPAANPVLILTLKMPTLSNEHWTLPLSNIPTFCPCRTLQQNDKRSWSSLVGRHQMSVLLTLLWGVSEQPGDEHHVQKRFATSVTEQIGSHLSGPLVAKVNPVSGLWWDDLQHYSKVSFE